MRGGRARLVPGTYGDIRVTKNVSGSYQADAWYRDWDGRRRRVTASGPSKQKVIAALKEKLLNREVIGDTGAMLTAESSFGDLVALWLEDLELRNLSEGSREVYRREVKSLLAPTFSPFTLGEITTGRLDRFLKVQAGRSAARARHSKSLLNQLMNFAVRHDAIARNPVTSTTPLKAVKPTPKALTLEEIEMIRAAALRWRTGPGVHGPRPDGQVRDIIEVMLGSATRIGEALALRKCDVDMTAKPATISGTIVCRTGQTAKRQDHPKTTSSVRTLAIPSFAAEVIRGRLVLVAGEPDDHLLFFTKEGTPLSTYNVRRSLREIVADAGLAGREITPHTFRKTGATFISRGSDEESAAKFLGHGNSAITKEHYIEVDEDAIVDPMPAAILEKLGPQKRRVAAADAASSG